MAESILYQQYDNSLNIEHFAFHNLVIEQKPSRRLSFSALLLQKKRSRMGRSQSKLRQLLDGLYGKEQKAVYGGHKAELKVLIPFNVRKRSSTTVVVGLEKSYSFMTCSSTDEEDNLKTPTIMSSHSHDDDDNESDISEESLRSVNLETAVTIPPPLTFNTLSKTTLTDYSHDKGYSNFYIKLPNGNWMVRIRDTNRKIVGTYEIDGSM
ncbi:uncharacterized protein BX663DRAFT_510194, partial [Cokeromyces recurvatus]|uniref:uncharacterized protein n=1 Tax=Cokeromyces recurvatus TaxID=90255 RepID=UPI00221EDF2A